MEQNPFPQLEQLRVAPNRPPIMRQTWRHLTFFHQKIPAELIQPLIPKQLTIQTYQGDAYIGFVPFVMEKVRINGLPPLPNHRRILETNIRTYVTDPEGRPGVWFFSLDCDDHLAITAARTFFGLNYLPAHLHLKASQNSITYSGTRTNDQAAAYRAEVLISTSPGPAKLGTLEFWLAERYLLFAQRGRNLISGQVHHTPYPLITPDHASCHESMITATTCLPHETSWDSILYSPGVQVEIFSVQIVSS